MNSKKKLYFLTVLLLILVTMFIFLGLNSRSWGYALSRRIPKIIAIVLTGSSIAFSSIIFQTIINNRILTPSILGLDSLYMFIQTFTVFVLGSNMVAKLGPNFNFIVSAGLMVIFSIILFRLLFKKEGSNIFFLLLLGLVFGTFFQSLSSFMQVLIDPSEFMIVQNKMFASFNNVNTKILWIALVGVFGSMAYTYKYLNALDVLSLGRDNAINLGIEYDNVVKKMLIIISILVSISTALVGPITFLGLLVVNITREILKTYQHKYLIMGSILISSIALVGGQLFAERISNFSTPISVIINFIGGVYFIFLLLKESRI